MCQHLQGCPWQFAKRCIFLWSLGKDQVSISHICWDQALIGYAL